METLLANKNKNLFRNNNNTIILIEAVAFMIILFLLIYLFFPQPAKKGTAVKKSVHAATEPCFAQEIWNDIPVKKITMVQEVNMMTGYQKKKIKISDIE